MSRTDVHGTVADGYEQVRDAFAAVVAERDGQAGAQLTAYAHGRQVVDLWAGDEVSGDTLTGVYSSTKGAATLVAALLVQEGVLDPDEPVARHWPEFAAAGKGAITLRDVLTHRSGVIGVDGGLSAAELADDAVIARRLAGQRPYWRPGAAYGYGGFVSFAMVNEVIRRVTGQSLQQVYDERIRIPYGLDLYLGLPEAEEGRFRPIQRWAATREQEAAFCGQRARAGWPVRGGAVGEERAASAAQAGDRRRVLHAALHRRRPGPWGPGQLRARFPGQGSALPVPERERVRPRRFGRF